MKTVKSRTETGKQGAELVCKKLENLGYKATPMPNHNRGFDIRCQSPKGYPFHIEVKSYVSIGTQARVQIKTHLECPLEPDRFYVFVRLPPNPETIFCVMSHEEVQTAWSHMPRTMPNGKPYVIGATGHIDWKYINPHRDRWDKLPE